MYTQQDLDNAVRLTKIHHDVDNATQALLRAQGLVQHGDCRDGHALVVGRFERIQSLLGELKTIMLHEVGD